MSTRLPDVISRYFERDTDRDIESIVSLFADDATVIDEREERHGAAAIRAWQTGAASKYTYTTEITGSEALGPDRYLVAGRLTGNFPGRRPEMGFHHRRAAHHAAHHRSIVPALSARRPRASTPHVTAGGTGMAAVAPGFIGTFNWFSRAPLLGIVAV
jgi:hypothetical protein